MYLFSNKKTKISIDFEGNTTNFELCPFDTLNHLKEVVIQYYPEIALNSLLYHQNKLINDYDESIHLSELTKGKTFFHLTIVKPSQLPTVKGIKRLLQDNITFSKTKCSCETENNTISFFCLNCKDLMCLNCKTNHNNHKTFLFDINSLKDSAKSFAISLQAELSDELSKYKKIEDLRKSNLKIDFCSWKKEIIKKLNQIELIFNSIREYEEIFNNQMGIIEKIALNTSNKIEKKLNDYLSKKTKGNSIDQAIEVFKYFSNSNEVITSLIKENELREQEFQANKAINKLLINLDNSIGDIERLSQSNHNEIKNRLNSRENTKKNESQNNYCINNKMHLNNNDTYTLTEHNWEKGIKKQFIFLLEADRLNIERKLSLLLLLDQIVIQNILN